MDNVPLYGARKCWCGCDRFVAVVEGNENLPAMTQDQTAALWSKTSFLNAQVPAATRMAMAGILNLLEVASTDIPSPAIVGAVREFMGLMISQVTDIRGALTRDDSKFALLVAHTDEVVESMRAVNLLAERLTNIYAVQERVLEAVDKLAAKVAALTNEKPDENRVKIEESAMTFGAKSAPLWNEAIVTDADTLDD